MHRFLVLLFFTGALYAQPTFVEGTVLDVSGAVIPGAEVRTEERAVRTDGNGAFRLRVPAGKVEVRASHTGFSANIAKLDVPSAGLSNVRIVLSAASVTEQLQVSASAELLQTSRATQGGSLGSRELQSLPTASRNVTHLIVAEAGVNAPLPDRTGRGGA